MKEIDGIREPLARPLHMVLRRAVADHAARERRRVHPPLLHVGWPGGREDVFAVGPRDELDQALRADVVAAMVHTARRHAPVVGAVPMLWLTRSGLLEVGDLDLAWLRRRAPRRRGGRRPHAGRGHPQGLVRPATDVRRGSGSGCGRDDRAGQSQVWAGSLVCIRSR